MLYELRPVPLGENGLVEALRRRLDAVERRVGVAGQVVAEGSLELPPLVEEGLYRIAQEALNNVFKHAGENSVAVHIRTGEGRTVLTVRDNGRGFEPGTASGYPGLGLQSMTERAAALGGTISISSKPGKGTVVEVSVEHHS